MKKLIISLLFIFSGLFATCPDDQFDCGDGTCIPSSFVCDGSLDGDDDCENFTDECGDLCGSTAFDSACTPVDNSVDIDPTFELHCEDLLDESSCTAGEHCEWHADEMACEDAAGDHDHGDEEHCEDFMS